MCRLLRSHELVSGRQLSWVGPCDLHAAGQTADSVNFDLGEQSG